MTALAEAFDTAIEEINAPAIDTDRLATLTSLDARRSHLYQPKPEEIAGIWDDEVQIFAKYRVTIRCTGKLMGGIPIRPDVIEGWLRTRTGIKDDEELLHMMRQTLIEQGVEIPATATYEEMVKASEAIADEKHGNGFKFDEDGLFIEARQVKALLRESCAIVYPWDDGKNKLRGKTPRAALAETIFVAGDRISLGRMKQDGTHLQVGQVSGPSGKRSTLTHYDFCEQPTLTFEVFSFQDCLTMEHWKNILVHAQLNGLGALRSQSAGQFKVTSFAKTGEATKIPPMTPKVEKPKPAEGEEPKGRGRAKKVA